MEMRLAENILHNSCIYVKADLHGTTLTHAINLRQVYDMNRSDRQFDIMEIVYDFSMTRAARATKIACDNRKQKSYRVNRPLKPYDNRSDRQFDILEIVYDFSMTRAARATEIACDNRKQKWYRVNRP